MSYPSAVSRSDRTLSHAKPRGPRLWRWLVVLVIVLCVHWFAAQWVERNRETFTSESPAHVPVQIALLTPQRIEQSPEQAAAPHPAAPPREQKAKPAPAKPREHVLSAAPSVHVPAPVVAASEAAASAAAAEAASAAASAASAASAAAHAAPGVKFSVPPSGDLQYDTFYNGVRNQPGTIHWSSDGKTYDIVVSVPVPFVGSFTYSSHGHVDAFGLAPDQYIEKRGRRPQDVSVFNRTTKQIVFTKTPNAVPLTDGAQDRFSMVMQLASLVRGDPDAYKPGVTRQFFVVDNDSGEIWPIETIGDETIRTQQGYVSARHFMRLPRHAGDQRRIDVWLAPSLGWLPARILQTEPNGTEVQLVWNGPLTPPGANGNGSGTGAGSRANGASNGANNGGSNGNPANASNSAQDAPANATQNSADQASSTAPAPEASSEPAVSTTPAAPPAPPTLNSAPDAAQNKP